MHETDVPKKIAPMVLFKVAIVETPSSSEKKGDSRDG